MIATFLRINYMQAKWLGGILVAVAVILATVARLIDDRQMFVLACLTGVVGLMFFYTSWLDNPRRKTRVNHRKLIQKSDPK